MGDSLGGYGFSPFSSTFTVDFSMGLFNHDRKIIKKKTRIKYDKFLKRIEDTKRFSWTHSSSDDILSTEQPMSAPEGKLFWFDPLP